MEAGFLRLLNGGGRDADDVGAAAVERGDFVLGDVKAADAESLGAEKEGEGQTDIAHADDSDAGFAGFHVALELSQTAGSRTCHGVDCN